MTATEASLSFPFSRGNDPINPPPEYARLRAEPRLVRARLWNGSSTWLLTRWADVREVLGSPDFSVDAEKEGYPTTSEAREAQLRQRKAFINMDAPDHMRFRRMLTADFMAQRLEKLRPLVNELVESLLDSMTAGRTSADFVSSFSKPLPANVISVMLGVPHEEHEKLCRLSGIRNDHKSTPAEIDEAAGEMAEDLERIIAGKITRPTGDDLLTRLAAEQLVPGNITMDEAVRLAALLYSAGHETTANQIGLGLLSLLSDPEQKAALMGNPALLRPAVEEMLRFHSVAHLNSARVAIRDTTIGGQLIRKGEGVYPLVAAANRDPDVFPDPDRFDITRPLQPHMAFAWGVHQCLGQPLARLELMAVFGRIFSRLPDLRLAVSSNQVEINVASQTLRVRALPVSW